ncbi:MAG: RNA polymerase sigma-70 factor [Chitinophaga sp.]|uniref:RNA polymerase sigma-70 factor n=1 Tax=Chitinophaga sp. TaxID=1869181 RepID=UPI001B2F4C5B|nr:RNA polymerase sigma-70 factor [Chitinophaga sp.]MBO9727244.1 RNA polymerase sigma-70 factor [Chitinophaga sp.]
MVLDVLDDEDCYNRLRAGDEFAFRHLIGVYGPVLCRYADRMIMNSAAAEDIVTEVLVKVWEKRETFNSFNNVKRFFYVAARNAALQYIRDRQREQRKFEAFNEVHNGIAVDEVIYAEMMAELQKAIAALPAKMKEVFILGYVRQLTNQEIALQLNLSEQTVRNQKTKALTILRNKLGYRSHLEIYLAILLLFR